LACRDTPDTCHVSNVEITMYNRDTIRENQILDQNSGLISYAITIFIPNGIDPPRITCSDIEGPVIIDSHGSRTFY
jgi:hypothetical protein